MQAMSLQDKRVLVVEDEALLAMMLEDVFSDAGAQVVGPAATVEQAIALIAPQVIDVALLDVCLRDQRSDPVAEALRQRGVRRAACRMCWPPATTTRIAPNWRAHRLCASPTVSSRSKGLDRGTGIKGDGSN
jgi:CheY-like chemotaxis protein